MVTGKRAFEGKTTASMIAAIIASHPPPISTIQPTSPPMLERLIKSCLAKDPDERLQTAHDVKLELKWVAELPMAAAVAHSGRSWIWMTASFVLLIVAIFITAAYFIRLGRPRSGTTKRLAIRLSGSAPLALARLAPLDIGRTSFTLSPNGTRLVYVADLGDTSQLYVRPLDQFEARPLPGTQGAYGPFFSPDGTWVGFFAENKLKKVSLQGGDPVVLCEARTPHGGSWGPHDTIVFRMKKATNSSSCRPVEISLVPGPP
jgi:serine/threonine-protein kinase